MSGTLTLTGNNNTVQVVPPDSGVATVSGVQSQAPQPTTPYVVNWTDIQGKPTFGTAASRDVPAVGDAATNQVVLGTDTRLTNQRHTIVAWIDDAGTAGKNVLLASTIGQAQTAIGAGAFGATLIGEPTAAQTRIDLGLGNAATLTFSATGLALAVAATPAAARAVISAADGTIQYGRRNLIINGAANSLQYNNVGTPGIAISGQVYITDMWFAIATGGMTNNNVSIQAFGPQAGVSPGYTLGVTGNSIKFTNSAIQNPSTAETQRIGQPIEGVMARETGFGTANCQSLSLSFWARSSMASGTFAAAFRNAATDRSYVMPFTCSATPNTWQRYTFVIPPLTSGTWDISTNAAFGSVNFCFTVGSTLRTASPLTWLTGNFLADTTMTQLASTAGATAEIALVQLEVGTAATPFEVMAINMERQLCQRYWQVMVSGAGGGNGSAVVTRFNSLLPVFMRANPGASLIGSPGVYGAGVLTVTGIQANLCLNYVATLDLNVSGAVPNGGAVVPIDWSLGLGIALDARL